MYSVQYGEDEPRGVRETIWVNPFLIEQGENWGKIAPRDVEGALVGFHYSVIAEVFTVKEANDHAFIDLFTPLWRGKEGVSIRALGGARFIARFVGKKDMLRVLEMDKPWVFRDDMVLVVDGSREGRASYAPLFLATIWVQLNNVPPLCMLEAIAKAISAVSL